MNARREHHCWEQQTWLTYSILSDNELNILFSARASHASDRYQSVRFLTPAPTNTPNNHNSHQLQHSSSSESFNIYWWAVPTWTSRKHQALFQYSICKFSKLICSCQLGTRKYRQIKSMSISADKELLIILVSRHRTISCSRVVPYCVDSSST